MSSFDVRAKIRQELLRVEGLGGGPDIPDSKRLIHSFWYENDDVREVAKFWQLSTGEVNGVMMTRTEREDREIGMTGIQEFATVHRIKLVFRYAKGNDPAAEKRFEELLESIMDRVRGNRAIFSFAGLHPQPEEDQVARAVVSNVRLFDTRVWQAEITISVVEFAFKPSPAAVEAGLEE